MMFAVHIVFLAIFSIFLLLCDANNVYADENPIENDQDQNVIAQSLFSGKVLRVLVAHVIENNEFTTNN